MQLIDKIKYPIKDDLKEFRLFFKKQMKSKVPLLDVITNYLLKQKGKQMRPILIFLSARLFENTNPSTFHAAGLIELLHTATLVHDDVVDEAYERRSLFSINALWKNKVAVLVGDYLLSKGLLLATEHKEYELLDLISQVVKEMSEGELLQIEKSKKLDIDEATYFDIIYKKTASLISACTTAGAMTTKTSKENIEKIREFGKYLGIAFQIKDDLFDYQKTNLIGKPTGNDIKEKKLTLPLIYVLNNVQEKERKAILKTIRKHHNNSKKVNELIALVKEKGGLDYTEKIMLEYKNKALEILNQFENNEAKVALTALVEYVIVRKK